MLSGKFVAKGGNANATLRADFVKVVFFDPVEVAENTTAADNSTGPEKKRNRDCDWNNCSRFATALNI